LLKRKGIFKKIKVSKIIQNQKPRISPQSSYWWLYREWRELSVFCI